MHQCLLYPQMSTHPLAALTAAEVMVACYDVSVAALVVPLQVLVTAHVLALHFLEHEPLHTFLFAMQSAQFLGVLALEAEAVVVRNLLERPPCFQEAEVLWEDLRKSLLLQALLQLVLLRISVHKPLPTAEM